MALPDWQHEILPPEYGADVSPGLPATFVRVSDNDWELVRPIFGVTLGKIGAREAFAVSHGRDVLGLQPGLVRAEYPIGETLQLATTFIRQFLDVMGDFPPEFHAIGWVHSTDKTW